MADYILDLLNANESVNYSFILSAVLAYIIFMWFIVCIWLFFDAKKRYKSVLQPIIFSVFALIFNIPALIFYIIMRPEHTLDEDYFINLALSGEKQSKPIYFEGDRGFDININLSVQPKANMDNKHEMNVDVSWMPKNSTINKNIGNTMKHNRKSISLSNKITIIKRKFKDILLAVFGLRRKGREVPVVERDKSQNKDLIQSPEENKHEDLEDRKIKNKEKRKKRKKKKRKRKK